MIIRRPAEAAPAPRVPGRPQSAMEAAIERAKARYIPLKCGHGTNWDIDQVYRIAGSPRDKFFCEKCGKWVKPQPRQKQKLLPQEPLF